MDELNQEREHWREGRRIDNSAVNENFLLPTFGRFGPIVSVNGVDGGYFKAIMSFPPNYPNSPPTVRFTSEMWHPNVYSNGKFCISILHPPGEDPNGYAYELASERWTPVHTYIAWGVVLSYTTTVEDPPSSKHSVCSRMTMDSFGLMTLNKSNYRTWRSCMESYLASEDLWDIVCGDHTIPPSDTQENYNALKDWKKKNGRFDVAYGCWCCYVSFARFAPSPSLSAESSLKLNEVLVPNPFDRPCAVLRLGVLKKPIVPADLYKAVRDSQLVGMLGYTKEGLPVDAVGVGLSTYDKASVSIPFPVASVSIPFPVSVSQVALRNLYHMGSHRTNHVIFGREASTYEIYFCLYKFQNWYWPPHWYLMHIYDDSQSYLFATSTKIKTTISLYTSLIS